MGVGSDTLLSASRYGGLSGLFGLSVCIYFRQLFRFRSLALISYGQCGPLIRSCLRNHPSLPLVPLSWYVSMSAILGLSRRILSLFILLACLPVFIVCNLLPAFGSSASLFIVPPPNPHRLPLPSSLWISVSLICFSFSLHLHR